MRVSLLLCLVAAAPGHAADEAGSQLELYLASATLMFEKLEYEKALEKLQVAKKYIRGPKDDARIAMLEGILFAELGRNDDAQTALLSAFSLNLQEKLPFEVSPKVAKQVASARSEVRKRAARQRVVAAQPSVSTPPDATLPVDAAQPTNLRRYAAIGALGVGSAAVGAAIYGFVVRPQVAAYQQQTDDEFRHVYDADLQRLRTQSIACSAVALAAFAVGGWLFATADNQSGTTAVALSPVPGGAVALIRGQLPAF